MLYAGIGFNDGANCGLYLAFIDLAFWSLLLIGVKTRGGSRAPRKHGSRHDEGGGASKKV